MVHDGFEIHPGITSPEAIEMIRNLARELRECCRDHPADERLSRIEANLRWLVGERI